MKESHLVDTSYPDMPKGKRRLIESALALAAKSGDLTTIGLRELGREAGLNPNTFYRHFKDMEELGLAVFDIVVRKIRQGLAEVRRGSVTHADATRGSAEYFFKFVLQHPTEMLVGQRMINGVSPALRKVMRETFDEIAEDIAIDLRRSDKVFISDEALRIVTSSIVYRLFYKAQDYIDNPSDREHILNEMVQFSRMLFLGALRTK